MEYGEKVRINLRKFRKPGKKLDGMDALKVKFDKDIEKEWNISELYKFLFTRGISYDILSNVEAGVR